MLSRLQSRLAALRGLRADMAALGLGALAAVALPPFHAIPVLLLSVPGLLVLLDAARSPMAAARRGWWFGLGHHVLGLYWVTEAILFEAARFWWLVPLAVPALAAALALFIAAACLVARCAPRGWPRGVALAGAWVLADLARQLVLTGFPWNPWGSAWEIPEGFVGDVFIQPAALDRRSRSHPGDSAACRRAVVWLALAHRGRGAARGLGCVRPRSIAADCSIDAANGRIGTGRHRAGPEAEPGIRRPDIFGITWT